MAVAAKSVLTLLAGGQGFAGTQDPAKKTNCPPSCRRLNTILLKRRKGAQQAVCALLNCWNAAASFDGIVERGLLRIVRKRMSGCNKLANSKMHAENERPAASQAEERQEHLVKSPQVPWRSKNHQTLFPGRAVCVM